MPRNVILVIAALIGGWLLFDGTRAFATGFYTTPSSGPYAGQLGPWATLVTRLGLDPAGPLLKGAHLLLAGAWLVSGLLFLRSPASGWWPLLVTSFLTLWYLPFGTIAGVIVIVLLFTPALRAAR
jgi:hypothetical protein